MTAATEARAAMRSCAGELGTRLETVTAEIRGQLAAAFPELSADPDMVREFDESIRANLGAGLVVLAGDAPAATVAIPDEAVGFARSLVHRRVGLDRLLEVYRVGHARVWRTWMDALAARIEDRDVLVVALRRSADALERYVERLVALLVEEFRREQARWTRRAAARRSEAVQRILGETGTDVDAASAELGHELRAPQTALVAWSDLPEQAAVDPERVERAIVALAAAVGAGRVLVVPVGASSAWAWIAGTTAPDPGVLAAALDDLGLPDLRLAVGATAPGLDGFRAGHRQALRAQDVARRAARAGRVTAYADVGALAVVGDDEPAIRDFVARELGALAGEPVLRETLATYLRVGGRAPRAAALLHTHRNTVLHRLGRAERLLGHRVDERRLELELALRLVEVLGERVLPAGQAVRIRASPPGA